MVSGGRTHVQSLITDHLGARRLLALISVFLKLVFFELESPPLAQKYNNCLVSGGRTHIQSLITDHFGARRLKALICVFPKTVSF